MKPADLLGLSHLSRLSLLKERKRLSADYSALKNRPDGRECKNIMSLGPRFLAGRGGTRDTPQKEETDR